MTALSVAPPVTGSPGGLSDCKNGSDGTAHFGRFSDFSGWEACRAGLPLILRGHCLTE